MESVKIQISFQQALERLNEGFDITCKLDTNGITEVFVNPTTFSLAMIQDGVWSYDTRSGKTVILGKRGSGKTVRAVERAYETGSALITHSFAQKKWIEEVSRELKKPVTVFCVKELGTSARGREELRIGKSVVVDEIETVLSSLTDLEIHTYSVSVDNAIIL